MGFAFTKFDATRLSSPKGKITINHDIKIEDLKYANVQGHGQTNNGLLVEFSYTISYKPSIGKIRLEGNFIDIIDNSKEVADEYKKNKEMPLELREQYYNLINSKSLVKSIFLSEQVGLPSPINMPKLKFNKPEESDDKASESPKSTKK
ncbi:hypothetical protein HN415_05125 [Candidatus Woesearchaeota archaeon]|nr:hypothetical protein [Candidatus Woesearchaeota archaeon]